MFCLILSAVYCYAYGVTRTKNEEGTPIIIVAKVIHGGPDKSNAIMPILNGHTLTVAFTENLGQVAVEVTTALGGSVQTFNAPTPNGLQMYIPLAGDYIVTFTLPNRDEYYGEFTVTD